LICPKCHGEKTAKNGLKYGLSVSRRYYYHGCRHIFSVQIKPPVPRQKRFSIKREILRQIIKADIAEDKDRLVKEYE
jgi:hypothetical protein